MEVKEIIINVLSSIFLILIIIFIFYIGVNQMNEQMNEVITYEQCCGGVSCTDTYYTQEDNLCHLVLCENNPLMKQSGCTYEGANKTFDLINGEVTTKK